MQKWYVDDGIAAGSLSSLRALSSSHNKHGPWFGYLVTALKCQLITKPHLKERASERFQVSKIELTDGTRVLRFGLGSAEACSNFIDQLQNKASPNYLIADKFRKTIRSECILLFRLRS